MIYILKVGEYKTNVHIAPNMDVILCLDSPNLDCEIHSHNIKLVTIDF